MEKDHVVEFRVFWDRNLYVKNSVFTKTAMNIVKRYYEKMLSYSKFKNIISKAYLFFVFLGPELFDSGKRFNQSEFVESILNYIQSLERQKQKAKFQIYVIVS